MEKLLKIGIIALLFTSFAAFAASAPKVTTLAASSITANSARLNGLFNPNGPDTTAWFEFNSNNLSAQKTYSGNSPYSISYNLTKLSPSTAYSFRFAASNSAGAAKGEVVSFTTKAAPISAKKKTSSKTASVSAASATSTPAAAPAEKVISSSAPIVVSAAVSSITTSSATLNGSFTANGSKATTYFKWGPKTTTEKATSKVAQKEISGSMSAKLTGLSPNTTYYFRPVGENEGGTSVGSIYSFNTLASGGKSAEINYAGVSTNSSSEITAMSAKLNAFIEPNGTFTYYWFEWGTISNFTPNTTPTVSLGLGPAAVSARVSNLEPKSVYYFRPAAQNSSGVVYGETRRFETPAAAPSYSSGVASPLHVSTFLPQALDAWLAMIMVFGSLVWLAFRIFT